MAAHLSAWAIIRGGIAEVTTVPYEICDNAIKCFKFLLDAMTAGQAR